jgi:hypothetical protein
VSTISYGSKGVNPKTLWVTIYFEPIRSMILIWFYVITTIFPAPLNFQLQVLSGSVEWFINFY